jgi:hypothetical protein
MEEEEGLVKKGDGYVADSHREPDHDAGPQEENYVDEPL